MDFLGLLRQPQYVTEDGRRNKKMNGGSRGEIPPRKVLMLGKILQIEIEDSQLMWDGYVVPRGFCMDVLLPDLVGSGTWRSVSFDYAEDLGWHVVGHPEISPVGLWARRVYDPLLELEKERFEQEQNEL